MDDCVHVVHYRRILIGCLSQLNLKDTDNGEIIIGYILSTNNISPAIKVLCDTSFMMGTIAIRVQHRVERSLSKD